MSKLIRFLVRNNATLFPSKEPHNLKGREIRIGAVVAPISTCSRVGGGIAGPETQIIDAMASALNFTAIFIASENMIKRKDFAIDHWKTMDGPWRTVLLETFAGNVDIAMGGYLLWPEMTDDFTFIYPFATDALRFYATNDKIVSYFTENTVGNMILQMTIVLTISALSLHHLERNKVTKKRG